MIKVKDLKPGQLYVSNFVRSARLIVSIVENKKEIKCTFVENYLPIGATETCAIQIKVYEYGKTALWPEWMGFVKLCDS
jgi:hypothetical protein